nr:hypothetical protein [Tanacetum cinerariifolium]
MDKRKRFKLTLKIFKDIMKICPRVQGQDFDAHPTDEEIMSFLRELGYTREINSLNDVVVDHMHQPWRTFTALINKSLSGKTTDLDKLHSEHQTDENESDSESDQEENEEEIGDDDEQEEDEFVRTSYNDSNDETKISDKAEGDEDEEMDYTTSQLYDDADVRLNKPVQANDETIQKNGTDAKLTNIQQGNENQEISQVIEDAHSKSRIICLRLCQRKCLTLPPPPVIQRMVIESLNHAILANESSQPQSSYEAATSLTEFELKKILIDKMDKSESYIAGTPSQAKSFGKSVQSEEPEFEVADSDMPQDQEENPSNDDEEPNGKVTSKSYKTYLGFALGATPPKKAQKFKKPASPQLSTVLVSSEEPTKKPKRVKRSVKKSTKAPVGGVVIRETSDMPLSKKKEKVDVARGKGIELLSEVALTEEAQYKEVQRKSLRDFHKTHPSGFGTVTKTAPTAAKIKPYVTNKGTSVELEVPDVTKEESSDSKAES